MLLGATTLQAQRISSTQEVMRVGQVLYNHPVKASFSLKNKGLRTLKISEVRTSCGCTTVNYPTSVGMGKEFKIEAVYDAKTLGHFHKQLAVYSNASKEPLLLTLQGVVVRELKDYTGDYPYTLGELKVNDVDIEFDNVNRGDRPTVKLYLFNNSNETLQPVLMHLPNYLSAKLSPAQLRPHHSGVATITLDSRELRDFGLTTTDIYLGMRPGDKVSEEKRINVSAILLPAFQRMTAQQQAQAPQMLLSADSLDLGTFGGKKQLRGEIDIENVGRAPLESRSLQLLGNGLEVSLDKTTIVPGTRARLKVTAIADQMQGNRRAPRVLMITNDPKKGKVMVKIKVG